MTEKLKLLEVEIKENIEELHLISRAKDMLIEELISKEINYKTTIKELEWELKELKSHTVH